MKAYEDRRHVYKEGPYTLTRIEIISSGHTSITYKFESTEDFETFRIPEHRMSKLFNLMDEAIIDK